MGAILAMFVVWMVLEAFKFTFGLIYKKNTGGELPTWMVALVTIVGVSLIIFLFAERT